jgi:hypothetical protein
METYSGCGGCFAHFSRIVDTFRHFLQNNAQDNKRLPTLTLRIYNYYVQYASSKKQGAGASSLLYPPARHTAHNTVYEQRSDGASWIHWVMQI